MKINEIVKEKLNFFNKFKKDVNYSDKFKKLLKKEETNESKKLGKPKLVTKPKEPRIFKVGSRFDKKKKGKYNIGKSLKEFILKAGIESSPKDIHKKILIADGIIIGLISILTIIAAIALSSRFEKLLTILLLEWTLCFIAVYLLSILSVFVYIDLKILRRTKQLENVLPDFLQLTSANISAGMPIDRALWLAVRPRFGVLAHEIEEIAKATIAGEDLEQALLAFAQKYNSKMLKETVNLLIAGIEAGGEMADLINKISVNIQETKLMTKEIAANVMTYVIFIAVATIGAAPLLFALATQLLSTTQSITSNINMDDSSGASGFFSFNFSNNGISITDFTNFSILMLVISSIFSVLIISVIRKGSAKEGLKLIPFFIGISIVIFIISRIAFSYLFGGFY